MAEVYLTTAELLRVPVLEGMARTASYRNKMAGQQRHIFLSHAHKDRHLIEHAAKLLGDYASSIYVDWQDDSMPTVTSADTALRLKAKIAECKKLVLLATANALISKWAPWELGVGDQANGMDHVAILPVADPSGAWPGSEYLGIYRRIVGDQRGKYGVFEPNKTHGVTLEDWLGN